MEHDPETSALRVVTYNVLADAYVRPDRYPLSSRDDLDPGPRRQRLLARLTALDADVYCLQEVERSAFAAIDAHLPDHEGHLQTRRGHPDGCAIFIRRAAAAVEDVETLHYAAGEHLALIAYLRHGGRPVAIASTHLRWQPQSTPTDEHVGRLQLLELLQRWRARRDEHPAWIIAGDFNANSQSSVVAAALDQGLRLGCRTQRPWDTTNIGGRRRKIDYLLYTPESLDASPGTLPQLERTTPMPSSTEPSDHLPVEVAFSHRRPR